MELGSVLALQTEMLNFIYSNGTQIFRELGVDPDYDDHRWARPEDIGIGIRRRSPQGFELAVRVQSRREPGPLVARIRDFANGEVEVLEIGDVIAHQQQPGGGIWQRSPSAPLRIGCSVGHIRNRGGTIGCFVHRRGKSGEPPHILSSGHVLAYGRPQPGDDVIQPSLPDSSNLRVVASLVAGSDIDQWKIDNEVEAAIAAIVNNIGIDSRSLLPPNQLAKMIDPAALANSSGHILSQEVFKIGRTTEWTSGIVNSVMANVKVRFPGPTHSVTYWFDEQLEIMGTPAPFSKPGDSGSLVFNRGLEAVGLLMAGSSIVSYANKLPKVMDELSVDLIV
jgi:hypothetical protein